MCENMKRPEKMRKMEMIWRRIPRIHLENTRDTPGEYPEFTRRIPRIHQENTQDTPGEYPDYTRRVPGIHQVNTQNSPGEYPERERELGRERRQRDDGFMVYDKHVEYNPGTDTGVRLDPA